MLAAFAVMPYLILFSQPFISDDYIQLDLGRRYGAIQSWGDLAGDALYRCRATSIVLTHWTEMLFGVDPLPYYASSVVLHAINTILVFVTGWQLGLGRARSFLAGLFFAVQRGHQEAVMWYAALPELLLFLFCACFLLSWNAYARRGLARHYAAALLCFVLALLSKEAGVILAPVATLMLYHRKRNVLEALPLWIGALFYTALVFAARNNHLHFQDGTFSLQAPFLLVWARSIGRLFWVWGLVGLASVAFWRPWEWRRLRSATVWMGLALLPFSFLLYMPVVPSRHTYLASAGLGFFVAAGLLAAKGRFHAQRWLAPALLLLVVASNTGYVWTKKRAQFQARAEATEGLLELAKETDGPIYITCFPYGREVAEKALEVGLGQPGRKLLWGATSPPGATSYCAQDP